MKGKTGYIDAARIIGNMNLGPGSFLNAPGGFIGKSNNMGNIFFIDPTNGNDAWDGTLPTRYLTTTQGPKASTAAAYALCAANNNDVIVRLPGMETPTATLVLNLQGVTIMKAPNALNPYRNEDCAYYWAGATGPIFQITAPTALIGLEMAAAWADGGTAPLHGCSLELNGNAGGFAGNFCYIAYCGFPGWGEAGGICFRAGSFNHIYKCFFANTITTFGITLRGDVANCTDDIIEECLFKSPSGIQAAALGNHQNIEILKNQFLQPCAIAVNGIANFLPANPSNFHENICGMVAANAMDGNKAAGEAAGIFEAGNFYNDLASPRL